MRTSISLYVFVENHFESNPKTMTGIHTMEVQLHALITIPQNIKIVRKILFIIPMIMMMILITPLFKLEGGASWDKGQDSAPDLLSPHRASAHHHHHYYHHHHQNHSYQCQNPHHHRYHHHRHHLRWLQTSTNAEPGPLQYVTKTGTP